MNELTNLYNEKQVLGKVDNMSFMEDEIIYGWFDVFETPNGTECIPEGILSMDEIIEQINNTNVSTEREAHAKGLYEHVNGWFCRLSAPGYMDCTEWSGPFESEAECKDYLKQMYGDDDDLVEA